MSCVATGKLETTLFLCRSFEFEVTLRLPARFREASAKQSRRQGRLRTTGGKNLSSELNLGSSPKVASQSLPRPRAGLSMTDLKGVKLAI